MPSIGHYGRYLCTRAELLVLLDETCEDMIDVLACCLDEEDLPVIAELKAVTARALQTWHESASPASPPPEEH